jgi:hypothetical protein
MSKCPNIPISKYANESAKSTNHKNQRSKKPGITGLVIKLQGLSYSVFLTFFFSVVVVVFFTVSTFFEVSAPIFMPVSFFVVSTVVPTLVEEESTILDESELELELFPLHAAKEKHTAAARNDTLM